MNEMTRREFLRATGLAVLAGGPLQGVLNAETTATSQAAAGQPPKAGQRPNILVLMADDWGYPFSALYGDKVVKTPAFERLAREGVLFNRAYCASPSCTPSRASLLTGQMYYRLEESGNLNSTLDRKFAVYPDLLEAAGYVVGLQGKGWGPGDFAVSGWKHNPAGPGFKSFPEFLKTVPPGRPFCFWFGSHDPHRPYEKGSGLAGGLKPQDVQVPPWLPDCPETRGDILDYCWEVQRFDQDCGAILAALDEAGLAGNTLIVMTGDNGFPFPRGKCNLYDCGVHQPMAVRWPAKVQGGRKIDDFVSFTDLAPTFLQAAGLAVPADMTGRSLLDLLTSGKSGRVDPARGRVIVGRERHSASREGFLGYPARAIRTEEFLYIRNFRPERWPAGDGDRFGDIDGGPTKAYMIAHRDDENVKPLLELAMGKRPAEELYDLKKDPAEMVNVADRPEYAPARKKLADELMNFLAQTKDPRALGDGDVFDSYPYRKNAIRAQE